MAYIYQVNIADPVTCDEFSYFATIKAARCAARDNTKKFTESTSIFSLKLPKISRVQLALYVLRNVDLDSVHIEEYRPRCDKEAYESGRMLDSYKKLAKIKYV